MKIRKQLPFISTGILLLTLTACTDSSAAPEASAGAPESQQDSALASCLKEAGWDATPNPDGTVVVDHPIEQTSAYEAAADACLESLEANQASDSQATLRPYYDALRESATCLEAQGYTVDPAPTYDSWVEAAPESRWTPYVSLPVDDLPNALDACPQP